MSITSLVVSPVSLLAKNMSVETAVTLVIVNLAIGGISNTIALSELLMGAGKLAFKAIWIPSKYIYDHARSYSTQTAEEIEEEFEIVNVTLTVIKVSDLAKLLQNGTYDPNAIYQVIPDD